MTFQNETILEALYSGSIDRYLSQDKYKQWLTVQELGEIYLPTGKIVANDPLCLFEKNPFERTVAPGKYPVTLYLLHIDTDIRVAFAEITFNDNPPKSFELAIHAGEDITTLKEEEFFGYGVDSGTGGFMDYETCMEYEKLLDATEDYSWRELDALLDKSYVHTYSTANICLPGSEKNLVVFSSGYGDGGYPSFWVLDQNNEPCRLITDFCIIDTE